MVRVKHRSPDPFFLEGDQRGILLIHGFTGTTAEMGPMGKFFHELGYTVYAPLLAGHGTTPEEMANTTWKDWWKSVVEGYQFLQKSGCKSIYAIGLSMGGVLALRTARELKVNAVVPMSAPMRFKNKKAYFANILHHFVPYQIRSDQKAPHIEEVILPYDRTPVKAVGSLARLIRDVRGQLAKIHVPVMVVQGGQDETIYPEDAHLILNGLSGTESKELKWYPNSSHIIVLDHEREKMFHDIAEFLNRIEQSKLV